MNIVATSFDDLVADDGVTQQKTADELGWQLSKLKMYAGLKSVCDEAWDVVKVAINGDVATDIDEDDATNKVATATFTEGLLRNILDLDPMQQISLCQDLAAQLMSRRNMQCNNSLMGNNAESNNSQRNETHVPPKHALQPQRLLR